MANGSGLSFDPDPIKHFLPFLEPKKLFKFQPLLTSMESSPYKNRSPPSTIQFPVNLNCSNTDHNQEEEEQKIRPVIDEMDFFADHKKDGSNSEEPATTANNTAVDTERKESNTPPPELDFNINVSNLI